MSCIQDNERETTTESTENKLKEISPLLSESQTEEKLDPSEKKVAVALDVLTPPTTTTTSPDTTSTIHDTIPTTTTTTTTTASSRTTLRPCCIKMPLYGGAVLASVIAALVLAAAISTLVAVITADVPPTPGESCLRRCIEGDTRVCMFKFNVQMYQTLSRACHNCPFNTTDCERPDCLVGDGTKKFVYVINKKLPGPSIQVCKDDTVVVQLHNQLPAAVVTLHWHGITHTGGDYGLPSPFMDGMSGITQCAIPPGKSFKYSFVADNSGTHWWHSHAGFQRGDGVFGSLIVHKLIKDEPNNNLYDHDLPEHVIMFHDWTHLPTEEKFALRHFGGDDDFPESMLVNGRGPYQNVRETVPSEVSSLPFSRFNVIEGKRYRFRLISAAILNCPISIVFHQHEITLINSDGNDMRPFNATSLVMHPGERFDIVLRADQPPGVYWISFMGLVDCAESQAHQFAVLEVHPDLSHSRSSPHQKYSHLSEQLPSNKPKFTDQKPKGIQVNSVNTDCYEDRVCMSDLKNVSPLPDDMKAPHADHTHYLAFTMRKVHNDHFYDKLYYNINDLNEDEQVPSPQVNNLSLSFPGVPLLMRGEEPTKICSTQATPDGKRCHTDYCQCLHLIKVAHGDIVDLIFIDEGPHSDEGHSIHLHGHKFYVLGQMRPNDVADAMLTRQEVINMDKAGELPRNLEHPVLKDTVNVPDAGFAIVRFKANNPGYWILHCHLIFHNMAGMGVIIQVGEHSTFPSTPQNFPTCNNF